MRLNPVHQNTCGNRILMYREEQCTAAGMCRFLPECDQVYDETTGKFKYEISEEFSLVRPYIPRPKSWNRNSQRGRGKASVCKQRQRQLNYKIACGRAKRLPIVTTIDEAWKEAGLPK